MFTSVWKYLGGGVGYSDPINLMKFRLECRMEMNKQIRFYINCFLEAVYTSSATL